MNREQLSTLATLPVTAALIVILAVLVSRLIMHG